MESFMWRISVWQDGSTRLSRELILPLSQSESSVYYLSVNNMREHIEHDSTFIILVDLIQRYLFLSIHDIHHISYHHMADQPVCLWAEHPDNSVYSIQSAPAHRQMDSR
jgi:hypothetical protein